MVKWEMGDYCVVKDVVRENIGNLCKGDCSQASRYATSGKSSLVHLTLLLLFP